MLINKRKKQNYSSYLISIINMILKSICNLTGYEKMNSCYTTVLLGITYIISGYSILLKVMVFETSDYSKGGRRIKMIVILLSIVLITIGCIMVTCL